MNIKIEPVESANIKGIGYDVKTKTLAVQFPSGTYHYHDVGPEKYDAIMKSPSKGKYVHTHIKSHKFTRVS